MPSGNILATNSNIVNALLQAQKTNIKNKASIELRPEIVDTQECYGDWETDTIGKDNKGAIVTITERKTGCM